MKTSFIYGLSIAIAGTLLTFILYFLGFHDSIEKFPTGQTIGMIGGLIITVGGLVLAVKARRAETNPEEEFGFGRAMGAGVLTGLFASLFGSISNVTYMSVINPNLQDMIIEGEIIKLEDQGLSAEQIEGAEGMIRMMTGPVASGIMGFVVSFVVCVVLSLIIAAVLKRPAADIVAPPIEG